MFAWIQSNCRVGLLLSLSLFTSGVEAARVVDLYVAPETPILRLPSLLQQFHAPLSSEDELKCLQFLRFHFEGRDAESGRVGQNDLADWMLQRPAHSVATTQVLLEVIEDEGADLVWREFCVQKLAMAVEQPVLPEELKAQCRQELVAIVGETRISFAGTALLGLYRLSLCGEAGMSGEEIAVLAQGVYMSRGYATANKVTALQVAGLLGSKHALSQAREFISAYGEPIQLRVSSAALLGSMGEASDLEILRPYADDLDYRLRTAVNAAVRRIENRI